MSNTLTGALVARLLQEHGSLQHLPLALMAATCLYFAGNLLNDWADIQWDRKHRPERALPSGLFSPSLYRMLAALLVATGLGCATLAGIWAFIASVCLLVCIIIYTWYHKRTAWAVIPMAGCRSLLPLLGYFACSRSLEMLTWAIVPAALLFVYLIMLSLRARSESRQQSANSHSKATTLGLMLPPLMICGFWLMTATESYLVITAIIAAIPYLTWITLTLTIYRKPVSRQVSALLAGIPLIDGLFLLPLILIPYFVLGYALRPDPLTTTISYSWVVAFIAGRLLQRYVPAT